ncbi:hypothetical protein [Serratia sp. (in: enterobacteria)]|uniref:hypothetical protein n=1 Tax=Serratia sp. (in: enterobacteria) TaxID=616 RepID=UPI0039892185
MSIIGVGEILTALSLITAFYYYKKSKKTSILCYKVDSRTVINDDVYENFNGQLSINFSGNAVRRLTISNIYIWNQGNTTLDEENLSQKNLLQLHVKETEKILSIEVIKSTKISSAVDVHVTNDINIAMINFDHLNVMDGAIIRVLHTSTGNDMQFKGELKDADVVDYQGGYKRLNKLRTQERICNLAGFFLMVAAIVFGLVNLYYDFLPTIIDKYKIPTGILPYIILFVIMIPVTYKIFYLWPSEEKYKIPSTLQDK